MLLFDAKNPYDTDPANFVNLAYTWSKSKEANVYYSWQQVYTPEVSFHQDSPLVIDLGYGSKAYIYHNVLRHELLYRIAFTDMPKRLILKPAPYCMFWSFGDCGDASLRIKYHYRDRYLSLHEWVDKKSFLAVLRQHHYDNKTTTIWTR